MESRTGTKALTDRIDLCKGRSQTIIIMNITVNYSHENIWKHTGQTKWN